MDILVITPRPALWEGMAPVFQKHGAALRMADTMEAGLESLRAQKASLALLDLELDTEALRKAVISVLMVDAMTNLASACGMGEEAFHDSMEGLGMIMDLPRQPAEADVEDLLARLAVIMGA